EAQDVVADVPLADSCIAAIRHLYSILFNHLVGNSKHAWGNRQAERLGGLEVDDELELAGLLHWQIRRLGTFQYFVHITGSTPIQVRIVRSVGHLATGRSMLSEPIHSRQTAFVCEVCDPCRVS